MNPRGISAVMGHGLCVFAFLCCACGSSHNAGVTNTQPEYPNSNKPSACLERGSACVSSHDCCTQWCVNGFCTLKSP